MRLVSCHISGFGTISDYAFDFSDGVNAFLQENGWGKTTFSVFIKAMFYGMEYSGHKKGLMEREHYRPWGGGAYGGSLTFSVDQNTYRVERTFGKNDKEDTFNLYSADTGLESKDYTSELGFELFEMDRDSFEKSIYMPQNSLTTVMTDSINAKMGDLTSAKEDINHFDAAVSRIDEARKSYTRTSKINPGKLTRIKSEIRERKENLDRLPALYEAYDKQQTILEERIETLKGYEKQKEELATKISEQSKKEQDLGAYRQLITRNQELQASLSSLDDFFASGIPTSEELEAKKEAERKIEVDVREIESLKEKLPSIEQIELQKKLFAEKVPDKEELEFFYEQTNRLHELRIQGEHSQMSEEDRNTLQELKYYFAKRQPNAEEIHEVMEKSTHLAMLDGQVTELTESYHNLEQEYKKQEYQNKANSSLHTWLLLMISIVLFVGSVAFVLVSTGIEAFIFGGISFAIAIILLAAFFVVKNRIKKERNDFSKDIEQRLEEARIKLEDAVKARQESERFIKTFLSDFLVSPMDTTQQMVAEIQRKADLYERLIFEEQHLNETNSDALEELSALQVQLYTVLQPYAACYGYDLYHDTKEVELIQRLSKDAESYNEYIVVKSRLEELNEAVAALKTELDVFLIRFKLGTEFKSVQEKLAHIESNLLLYKSKADESEILEKQIKEFSSKYDVHEETIPVEDLQAHQVQLDEIIAELNQFIATERENLSALSDEIGSVEDLFEEVEMLTQRQGEYEVQVRRLEKTYDYLQQAREQFLSKYMKPLQNGLRSYLKKLYDTSGIELSEKNFELDMDLNIRYNYQGNSKQQEYLSSGYQDLVSLCSRLALIDILYKKDKPVLILDDPFTNMDEEKISNAISLLKELADDRQIIYFTCHSSRML